MDLKLESTSLIIPSSGGEYTVKYSAENITDDVIMEFEGVPAWIENIQAVPDSGIISLTVEKSMETAYRRSDIRISLGENSCPATLSLTQKAAFTIIIHEDSTTADELHWDIIPEDKAMTFWSNARPQNYMEEHNTDSLLHERELFAIEGWAKMTGIPLEEYLSYITTPGDRLNIVYEGLAHDTRYTIFAYGMNGEGERTTDIYKVTTQTLGIQPSDNRITLEMGEITSRTATYSTNTTNDDYYCQGYDYAADYEGMSDEELDALCDEDEGLAGFGDVEPGFRSGFVALVGRPNAGKSTLLNACYGKKVAITSPVAQTTRRRMRAVVNRPGYQLVFVDTPGIHKPKDGLGSELNKSALFELNDVDVVAFLIDATKPIGRGDAWVAERVKSARSKKVLVLTKADEADPTQVMEQLKAAHELMEYDDEIVTSSVKNFNVDAFIETVAHFLPEGPRWFPEDMGTDASDETLVAEFVREKVLRRTRDEIPHSVGVICDALEQTKKVLRVHATIYVEREGQKGIIIGKGGEMIKHIGIDARRDLERIFGTQVFLELDVKVKAGWRDDETQIRRFGYNAED